MFLTVPTVCGKFLDMNDLLTSEGTVGLEEASHNLGTRRIRRQGSTTGPRGISTINFD